MNIHDKLDEFLTERRTSDGGWAEVRDEDIDQLNELIYAIIDAKFEKDEDSDLPIEFRLTDRTKYHRNHFFNVPYHWDRGEDMLFRALELADTNLSIAQDTLKGIVREITFLRGRD